MDYDKLSAAIINLPCNGAMANNINCDEFHALLPADMTTSARNDLIVFINKKLAVAKKEGHRDARHAAAELVNEAAATPSPVPADTAELPPLPAVCDGKEQVEFESWAKGEKYDMTTHPIHWLFMHPETNAARQGWKAALEYVSRAYLASRPAPVVEHSTICAICGENLDAAGVGAPSEAFPAPMAVVPEGWKLVPRQMTDAMRDAGNEIVLDRGKLVQAWKAMLEAAPSQPDQSAQEVKCATCGGTGSVDDGEIDCYPNGEPFMCGPIKCVKDCPKGCASPEHGGAGCMAVTGECAMDSTFRSTGGRGGA